MQYLSAAKWIGIGVLVLAAGFLWLRLDAVSAERDLAQQQAKIFEDANKAWVEREKQREAFQAEVLAGLQRLSGEVAVLRTTNESFQRRVNSNANSNRPLDPAERDALRLFVVPGPGGNGAAANQVRPADPSPPVRPAGGPR